MWFFFLFLFESFRVCCPRKMIVTFLTIITINRRHHLQRFNINPSSLSIPLLSTYYRSQSCRMHRLTRSSQNSLLRNFIYISRSNPYILWQPFYLAMIPLINSTLLFTVLDISTYCASHSNNYLSELH